MRWSKFLALHWKRTWWISITCLALFVFFEKLFGQNSQLNAILQFVDCFELITQKDNFQMQLEMRRSGSKRELKMNSSQLNFWILLKQRFSSWARNIKAVALMVLEMNAKNLFRQRRRGKMCLGNLQNSITSAPCGLKSRNVPITFGYLLSKPWSR